MSDELMPAASQSDYQPPPTIFHPTNSTRKGLCPVTEVLHPSESFESYSLYDVVHGPGSEKVILIMGRVQRLSIRLRDAGF